MGKTPPLSSTRRTQDALFEHYRIADEQEILSRLPEGLFLDRHTDGRAYLSVVSFRMVDMCWKGLPLFGARTYPQVNVRLYVHDGSRPGVFFLRNYVSNRLAAWAGLMLYGMPYQYRRVHCIHTDDPKAVGYESELPDGRHTVLGTRGNHLCGHENDPSTFLFFVADRYPLYARYRNATCCSQMLHAPWQLFAVENVERSHHIPQDLGLSDVLEPMNEVQSSPGVKVAMWKHRPLNEDPQWSDMESPPRLELPV